VLNGIQLVVFLHAIDSMNGRGSMHITAESVNTRNERYTICVLCLLLLTVISLYPCPCSPFYRHATEEDNFWYNHLNTKELPLQYRDAWSFIEIREYENNYHMVKVIEGT